MIVALPKLLWIAIATLNLQAPQAAPSPAQPSEGLGQIVARFERATLLPLPQDPASAQILIDPVAQHITIQADATTREAILTRLKRAPAIALIDLDAQDQLHVWLADWRVEALVVEASAGQPRQLIIGARRQPQPLRRRWLGVEDCRASMRDAPAQGDHPLCMRREDAPPLTRLDGLTDRARALDQLATMELEAAQPGDFARWRERRDASLQAKQWLSLAIVHASRDELELALAALKALEAFDDHRAIAARLGASLLERALLASLGDDQRERLVRLFKRHQRWLQPAAPWGAAIALGLRRAGAPDLALSIYAPMLLHAQHDPDTLHHLAAAYATAAYEAGQVDRAYFVALYLQEDAPKLPGDARFLKQLGTNDRPCERPTCTPGLLEQRFSAQLRASYKGWSVHMWSGAPIAMR